MAKPLKWILIHVLFFCWPPLYGQQKDIIGYFPSWRWQKNRERLNPHAIPYDKLTVVTYAFFYPLVTGEIVGMDPMADNYLLKGEMDSLSGNIKPNSSMVDLAHRHGAKVVLSIGGWEYSNDFPHVAADPQRRAKFAHGCVEHINDYAFDGIDVDWEFPGYVRHKGTPQDKQNFTLLLQTVRDSLQILGKKTGKYYLLSASLPAAASHLPEIEVQKITAILDRLNIMTYDLFGPWGKMSNHNSALFGPAQGDSSRCLDGAFKLYHNEHHVPAEKINLGVAFYGHAYANCTQIYSAHGGADTEIFPADDGVTYARIAERFDLFKRFWDNKAQAPYLVSESQQILVSFDDEESVARKADYVKEKNAGGLIIWTLLGDGLKDGRTPLLDAIYDRFTSQ
ncbi:MAG: glycoside hydrolase family 18 protein [bacterium]